MNPESLVSRIYRARYYPQGSFLSAKLGSNPSYIWRSIVETQDLLRKCTARRVGNGNTINILEDPWLPSGDDPYIHTVNDALKGQRVASLLLPDKSNWDMDLINDMFEERDANLILSISFRINEYDSSYWNREKLGQYSVKSAYLCIQEGKANNVMSDNSGFWRKLWNLKVPAKTKNFLWRASSGCLPTKTQLRNKNVEINVACPNCNSVLETIIHALVTCPFAQSCWNKVGMSVGATENSAFEEWLSLVLEKYRGIEARRKVMVCWALWNCRNNLVWNQKCEEAEEVIVSAVSALNQWYGAQDNFFDTFLGFMTQEDGAEHWNTPSVNKIKVNTDAAIFEASKCFSFSVVARDHKGELVEAITRCAYGSVSPVMAEAIGIKEALSWVKKQARRRVMVETDCLTAIQAIRSSAIKLSYLGRTIEDCKKLLVELKDHEVSLVFVKRSANKVAHFLARDSCSIADRVWHGHNVHPELKRVMLNDLNV